MTELLSRRKRGRSFAKFIALDENATDYAVGPEIHSRLLSLQLYSLVDTIIEFANYTSLRFSN